MVIIVACIDFNGGFDEIAKTNSVANQNSRRIRNEKKVWTHFQASRYILPKRKQRGDKTRNGSDCNKLDKILSFEKIGS